MFRIALYLVAAAFVAVGVAQPAAGGGRVRGKVLDEDGNPLAGAAVILQEQGGGVGQQRATAQTDGSFDFPAASKGVHTLCVHAPGTRTLNPCLWSLEEAAINTNVDIASRTIRVKKAGVIRLTVLDAAGLSAPGGGGSPIGFQAGVWTKQGFFYPLVLAGGDGRERIFELAVPFDEPLRLGFLGKKVTAKFGGQEIDTATWRHEGVVAPRAGSGVVELRLEITGLSK